MNARAGEPASVCVSVGTSRACTLPGIAAEQREDSPARHPTVAAVAATSSAPGAPSAPHAPHHHHHTNDRQTQDRGTDYCCYDKSLHEAGFLAWQVGSGEGRAPFGATFAAYD